MGKVIAFIPVRGGSKSIPLKNIKTFCGRPLVFWVANALNKCDYVDNIIIATDSIKIAEVVNDFELNKIKIYNRSPENATDDASTESVMLEYINQSDLDDDDIFILAQATSPLTQDNDYFNAIKLYENSLFDSMLSCVRIKRFLWEDKGTPLNYDYIHRPRRQNFSGILLENGAFYINRVKNIRANQNRLYGVIGIYEMPEYTSIEIDEEDDWIIAESLMYKHVLTNIKRNIKLFLSDVDGVLTDCGMYYSEKGDELKKFNTHDGMAFKLLREAGIKTGIITSENTKIVERRAKKLNVDYLYQGRAGKDKLSVAKEICSKEGIGFADVAYIGDDINCFELLKTVGMKACPIDANKKVKAISSINIMSKKGGEGCVREFVEMILGL